MGKRVVIDCYYFFGGGVRALFSGVAGDDVDEFQSNVRING